MLHFWSNLRKKCFQKWLKDERCYQTSLLDSVAVQVRVPQYLFQATGRKRVCVKCVNVCAGSSTKPVILCRQRVVEISEMQKGETIFSAVLTFSCRVLSEMKRAVIQLVGMLSIVPL